MGLFNFDTFAGAKMNIGNSYFNPKKQSQTKPPATSPLSQSEPTQPDPDVPTTPTEPTTYSLQSYDMDVGQLRPKLLSDMAYREQYLKYLNQNTGSQITGDQLLAMLNSENTLYFDQMHQQYLKALQSAFGQTGGSGRKDKGPTTGGNRGGDEGYGDDLPPITRPPGYPEPGVPTLGDPTGGQPYTGAGLTAQQNAVNTTLGTAIKSAKEMFKPSAETLRHHPEFANKLTPRQIKYIYDSLVASNQHKAFGSYRQFKEWIKANPQGYVPVEGPRTSGGLV